MQKNELKKSTYETAYTKRVWLNPYNSPSTGNMVMFDGEEYDKDGKEYDSRFLKISDCYHTVRIHQAYYDTEEDFLNKIILMRDELNSFIEHLQNKNKNE